MTRFIDSLIETGEFIFVIPRHEPSVMKSLKNFLADNYPDSGTTNHPSNYSIPADLGHYFDTDYGGLMSINNCITESVLWATNKISLRRLRSVCGAISFNFSGCSMACFNYNGKRYAAHIHIGDDKNCLKEWVRYISSICKNNENAPNITNFVMFKPHININLFLELFNKIQDTNIVGYVDSCYNCYTIYMYLEVNDGLYNWKVLYIYKHHVSQEITHYYSLLNPNLNDSTLKMKWDSLFSSQAYTEIFSYKRRRRK